MESWDNGRVAYLGFIYRETFFQMKQHYLKTHNDIAISMDNASAVKSKLLYLFAEFDTTDYSVLFAGPLVH